ncbi:unnamed protein product [Rotaria sordida]|uniref:Uncharacterized protein n=1 Tax=Rotaria sordida TaxID=392033 RepID=A0A819XZW1_9BILA|nr:unnamed protein product [Rotaria sordida]CAF4150419.1 unnamed protein product [Rotaria sordida]
MILKYELINQKLKSSIHAILGASYLVLEDSKLASESFHNSLESFRSSMKELTPPWLATFIASSHITQPNSNQILDMLEPLMNKEHCDNDVHEKMRLLHKGRIYSEQKKFVDALNHWEEAIEITSHMPTSVLEIFNGAIYVQMAAAYFRLNSISNALNIMERAKQCLESYYSSTHQLFGSFDFIYAYYLMTSNKSSLAIPYLQKALENPHFSKNDNFLSVVCTLLVMGYMDTYNLNLAEEYGYQAGSHILSETVRSQNPDLSEVISELMSVVLSRNSNKAHQYIRKIMQISQVLLSIINRNTITPSESTNEQTCTIDELIAFADHYRHQQDYVNAERYFTKALDKTTEINSKHVWNIYRKMTRMSNHGHYQDYFAVLYSKYDDDNPKHFQLISTIQIILYKLFLSENDFKTGFNCLINGIVMKIKFIHHQTSHIESRYILNLFYKCIDQEQIIKLMYINEIN